MDLSTDRYETWAALRTYCYRVAGTVGEMVAPIFGCRDAAALVHAAELGIAMQLTNILRDVGEDARLGRLYLPLDEIAAFGCDPEALLAGRPDAGFPDLMALPDRASTRTLPLGTPGNAVPLPRVAVSRRWRRVPSTPASSRRSSGLTTPCSTRAPMSRRHARCGRYRASRRPSSGSRCPRASVPRPRGCRRPVRSAEFERRSPLPSGTGSRCYRSGSYD